MRGPRGRSTAPIVAINTMVIPSHWMAAINAAATNEEPQVDVTWMLRHPYACLPPVKFWDHSQLAPTDLQESS